MLSLKKKKFMMVKNLSQKMPKPPKNDSVTSSKNDSAASFMLGNHIVAASAMKLGFECAASYPGTPSAEILEGMQKMGMKHTEWSINEKVALEVAAGAAISGIRSICSMKSVGLNVASDPLMTLSYIDLKAALLIVVADTPGCLSSQNEQDCRWYGLAAKVPIIEPISPRDIAGSMRMATEISEKLKVPVIIRLTTRIAHGRQSFDINSIDMDVPDSYEDKGKFVKDVKRFVMLPVHGISAHKKLFEKYERASKMMKPEASGDGKTSSGDGEISVIASGQAYANAKDIIHDENIKCKLIRLFGIPFDEEYIEDQVKSSGKVIVLEEGDRIIEDIVKKFRRDVISKKDSHGELGNKGVREILSETFGINFKMRKPLDIPTRTPRLCAACPHLMSYYWISKFDVPFPGDIGCYSLGYQYNVLDTLVCMGASIGMGQSIPGKKIAVLGDSTFYHAGIPALINAVEQNRDICVVILDNEFTAMTGHQPVPKINMERLCEACGAKVQVIDPFSKKTKEILKEALGSKGVNVIIMRRTCARMTEAKIKFTITDKCTDCGECDKIHCPAIVKKEDGSKEINDLPSREINDLCWGCGFCASICPEVAIRKKEREEEK
jgi:indolepyruvate ferredoxin oxidoreductase alpha subunit